MPIDLLYLWILFSALKVHDTKLAECSITVLWSVALSCSQCDARRAFGYQLPHIALMSQSFEHDKGANYNTCQHSDLNAGR